MKCEGYKELILLMTVKNELVHDKKLYRINHIDTNTLERNFTMRQNLQVQYLFV